MMGFLKAGLPPSSILQTSVDATQGENTYAVELIAIFQTVGQARSVLQNMLSGGPIQVTFTGGMEIASTELKICSESQLECEIVAYKKEEFNCPLEPAGHFSLAKLGKETSQHVLLVTRYTSTV